MYFYFFLNACFIIFDYIHFVMLVYYYTVIMFDFLLISQCMYYSCIM